MEREEPVALGSGDWNVGVQARLLTRLTAAQRTFLRVAMYFETDAAAARAIGIAPNTLASWKKKSRPFRYAYDFVYLEPVRQARAQLALLVPKAVNVLAEALDSKNERIRLKAAELILRSRDVQVIVNNPKAVNEQGEDLYQVLARRLASRDRSNLRVVPSSAPEATSAQAEHTAPSQGS